MNTKHEFVCLHCGMTRTSLQKNAAYCSDKPECQKARKTKNKKLSKQRVREKNKSQIAICARGACVTFKPEPITTIQLEQKMTVVDADLQGQNNKLVQENETLKKRVFVLLKMLRRYQASYRFDLDTGEI